jgi:hypothetical protein
VFLRGRVFGATHWRQNGMRSLNGGSISLCLTVGALARWLGAADLREATMPGHAREAVALSAILGGPFVEGQSALAIETRPLGHPICDVDRLLVEAHDSTMRRLHRHRP